MYLVGDLKRLALADIGGLGNSSLKSRKSFIIQTLSACDGHLYFTPLGGHQLTKLLTHTLKVTQSIVLSESL
jgi:hypothetical protein